MEEIHKLFQIFKFGSVSKSLILEPIIVSEFQDIGHEIFSS